MVSHRIAASYHDIGHAVVSEGLGREVHSVRMTDISAAEANCPTSYRTPQQAKDFLAVTMAGMVSERMFADRGDDTVRASSDDMKRIPDILSTACAPGKSPDDVLSGAAALAVRILSSNSNRVHHLAASLRASDYVGGNHPSLMAIRKQRSRRTAGTGRKYRANRIAGLRGRSATTFSNSSLKVDAENGVLYAVSLMTVGPALGHGFDIDDATLDGIVQLSNAQPDGVKSRFKHPKIDQKSLPGGDVVQSVEDDTGTQVGRIKNIRKDGDRVVGDIYLGNYASKLPGLGDVRGYLISHAEEDPAGIGMSAFFTYALETMFDQYHNPVGNFARPSDLTSFDFVGVPAANPAGLLSARLFDPQPGNPGWQDANPQDQATAPIPQMADFPDDARGDALRALAEHGPLAYPAIGARTGVAHEEALASAQWLSAFGYAAEVTPGVFKATPKGHSKAAMRGWKNDKAKV